jgi:hypothetical protein
MKFTTFSLAALIGSASAFTVSVSANENIFFKIFSEARLPPHKESFSFVFILLFTFSKTSKTALVLQPR